MEEEKKFNIQVSIHEVANLLSKHMVQGSCENRAVTNLIVGQLALTEKGISQLFKALLGIFPSLIYKEKDWVYVRLDSLPSWRMNKAATEALPNVKDGYILAQITECNVYKEAPYSIVYDIMKDGAKVATVDQSNVKESDILEKAEDFMDILDALEKMNDEKDLPF